jgi:hypothetical protein
MAVKRIPHSRNYVVLQKEVLEDSNLSLKAKGLWAYCMAKPDDWSFHLIQLATVLKEGITAIRSTIKELIENGYCKRIQSKTSNGRFDSYDYEILEIKEILPQSGFPNAAKASVVNPTLLSKDSNQVKKDNKQGSTNPAPKKGNVVVFSKEYFKEKCKSLGEEDFEHAWKCWEAIGPDKQKLERPGSRFPRTLKAKTCHSWSL